MTLEPEELDGIREALLNVGEQADALDARLISGGRSNLTYLLSDGRSQWVLRTPPRAGRTPSAHDVGREHRVTSALGDAGFPVARAVLHCEDESLLGGPFSVSAYVKGRTVRSQDELAAMDDNRIDQTVRSLVQTFADLHAIDHVAVGLERFGRPDGYAQRQLDRWAGQWDHVSPGDPRLDAVVADLALRLGGSVPTQSRTSVVHGDYRIDNALLDLTGVEARVAAVVDWELSTIGDPVADVAMMCAYRNPAFDLVLGLNAAWTSPRMPSADDIAEAYASASGFDLPDWNFHLALASFKIAVISAGISHRNQAATSDEPDTAGTAVLPYLEAGLDALS